MVTLRMGSAHLRFIQSPLSNSKMYRSKIEHFVLNNCYVIQFVIVNLTDKAFMLSAALHICAPIAFIIRTPS